MGDNNMTVDLNADIGEGFGIWRIGDDQAMLGMVTSANLACGFHAGDPAGLLEVCKLAAEAGAHVGAQVSYRDLHGFGRRFIDVSFEDLFADVIYQIGALQAVAAVAGTRVSYVKPHGALYNTVFSHTQQARAVTAAVLAVDPGLPVLGQPGSELFRQAEMVGLRTVAEVFADRAYKADGTLAPRREPGAVLHEPAIIAERAVRMVKEGVVQADDGTIVDVRVDSICLHGDSPGAPHIAAAVWEQLRRNHIDLQPFA
ncbi:LamB/YcsF family protein [Mycolicibacterium brumae]|nr:5-oxoprolinase subunit PxpA [Mycolicibacterium brumae]RWA21415.1 hypothetical protein MBRU_14470 [Mycolicibacterium brumae DSM 44177]UWW07375.1 LamB/YcsF family protein [Mycolicibacterium brumae]